MRVSIRKHNRTYLERLGYQMECDEPTEVINYLLTELKRIGYSFNAEVSLGIASSNTTSYPYESSEPTEPGQYAMSAFSAVNDPLIDHLISVGLDEF